MVTGRVRGQSLSQVRAILTPVPHPGSGPGARVIAEAGLDGDAQLAAILRYVSTVPVMAGRGMGGMQ